LSILRPLFPDFNVERDVEIGAAGGGFGVRRGALRRPRGDEILSPGILPCRWRSLASGLPRKRRTNRATLDCGLADETPDTPLRAIRVSRALSPRLSIGLPMSSNPIADETLWRHP
jgi:hypothetical protein